MTISLMGINDGRSIGLSGFPVISMNLHGILSVTLMLKYHTHVVFLQFSCRKCCRQTCIPDPKGLVVSILWPPSDFGMEIQTTRIIPRVSGRCIGWNVSNPLVALSTFDMQFLTSRGLLLFLSLPHTWPYWDTNCWSMIIGARTWLFEGF